MTKEKFSPQSFSKEKTEDIKSLILHNDDINTFDFIIETLIEVCGHDQIQAEQCALIAHLKGSCDILSGSLSELTPPQKELLRRNINASIE